jgi:hypothetical protein
MNISIMDPGLVTLGGHHFDQDYRLATALRKRGCAVQVHGHQDARAEVEQAFCGIGIQMARSFRVYTYVSPPAGNDAPDYWLSLSRATEEDLMGLEQADLAFWPSLNAVQILALARAPSGRRIVGGLDGNIDGFLPGQNRWGPEMIARSSRLLAGLADRVVIGAYDRRMAEVYGPLLPDLEIVRLPVPYDCDLQARRGKTVSRVGFFGFQRAERGARILPALCQEMLGRGKRVTVHDSSGSMRVNATVPNLKTLGFVTDITPHIAECDLVIWPSDPANYVTKTSGIVWNAIAAGVPLVLPSLCLPARIAHECGAAVFYGQNAAPSILEAFARAEENFPALAERASQQAAAWRSTEGIDRLAAAIVEAGR